MKLRLLTILFFIAISSCVSVKKHNEQISKLHAVKDLRKDIDELYLDLKKYHPKLYQYKSKEVLDYKFDSLKKSINKPLNSREFYRKTATIIAQMGHGHTSINPPEKKRTKEERKLYVKQKNEFNTLGFESLNKKIFISGVQKSDSLLLGAQVLKINNESISDILVNYRKTFSSDGFNTTFYDKVIGKHLKKLYLKNNGRVDSVQLTLKIKDSLFNKTFKKVLRKRIKRTDVQKDSVKIKLNKKEKKAKKIARKKRRKYNKIHGYNYEDKTYNRNLKFIGKDTTVAYIKIRSFSKGNYKDFYKQTFTELANKKTQILIIDLRYNGGGRALEINNLYSYLADKEFQFFTRSEVNTRIPVLKAIMTNTTTIYSKIIVGFASPFVAFYRAFKVEKENGQLYFNYKTKVQQPNPLNFKGKIYVLINGYSYSASAILASHLQGSKRAFFVGEETGGSYNGTVAGFMREHELSNSKVKIRFGVMHLAAPYKQKPDGYGIKPDVEITPTIKDRLSKTDPELDWILKDLESK